MKTYNFKHKPVELRLEAKEFRRITLDVDANSTTGI